MFFLPVPRSEPLPHNAALVHHFLCRNDGPASACQILDGLRPELAVVIAPAAADLIPSYWQRCYS